MLRSCDQLLPLHNQLISLSEVTYISNILERQVCIHISPLNILQCPVIIESGTHCKMLKMESADSWERMKLCNLWGNGVLQLHLKRLPKYTPSLHGYTKKQRSAVILTWPCQKFTQSLGGSVICKFDPVHFFIYPQPWLQQFEKLHC